MKKRTAGFTLIEVLVSLTLLSVVLGAVYTSFFSVNRAIERFDNISLKYHETRTVLDMMRREIEGSFFRMDESAKGKTDFRLTDMDLFGKSTSSLELTCFSFKGYSSSRVSYSIRETDGRLDLMKTEAPAGLDSEGYTIEIIEDIEGCSAEVLFNNKWVKTWDTAETDELPKEVRVTIEFNDNTKTVQLTEYARPMTGQKL